MKNCEPYERNSFGSVTAELKEGGDLAAEKIGRSIAYMIQHIDQPLQVAVLATQASVSPSHYFALFKRQTGCPPIDYFIRLRMERARELLESTTSSVKEIAAQLGYHDAFYFSRLFKSVNQISPTHYRQRSSFAITNQNLRNNNGNVHSPVCGDSGSASSRSFAHQSAI
jgi:transcriptional regulator GlxA family with amidase domain